LTQDLHFAKLASITAFQNSTETNLASGDETPYSTANYIFNVDTHTLTQEVQLSSEKGSPFDWVAGLYFLDSYAGYNPTNIFGTALAPVTLGGAFGPTLPVGSSLNIFGDQRIKDYAAYAQGTIHLGDKTNLTLGARYTADYLTGTGYTTLTVPGNPAILFPPGFTEEKDSFRKPTYKAALDHHFTDDFMAYASYSRGFKAGTYNTIPLSAEPVAPEEVTAHEIGSKSQFLDNKLQINDAVFLYNLSNDQVEEAQNGVVFLANAPAAKSYGLDLDVKYLLVQGLVARIGGEYLHAKYTDFPNGPFYSANPNQPYGTFVASGNATGFDMVRAPRATAYAGTQLRFRLADRSI
jgi:iron complex outermembrane recepter protein